MFRHLTSSAPSARRYPSAGLRLAKGRHGAQGPGAAAAGRGERRGDRRPHGAAAASRQEPAPPTLCARVRRLSGVAAGKAVAEKERSAATRKERKRKQKNRGAPTPVTTNRFHVGVLPTTVAPRRPTAERTRSEALDTQVPRTDGATRVAGASAVAARGVQADPADVPVTHRPGAACSEPTLSPDASAGPPLRSRPAAPARGGRSARGGV